MRQSNAAKQRRYRIRKALTVKAEESGFRPVEVLAYCKGQEIRLFDPDTGQPIKQPATDRST